MVRTIRQRRANKETCKAIGADLGLHEHTVWKYANDKNLAAANAAYQRHWQRAKADPEKMERRREAMRRFEAKNPGRVK
jgi:hypothetical protein